MSGAGALAFAAGCSGVLAAWEVLTDLDARRLGAWVRNASAPLHLAAGEGREPTDAERRRLAVLVACALAAAAWLVSGPLAAGAAGVSGPALAGAVLRGRRRQFRRTLATQVASVARALADALSGGASVRGAVAAAALGLRGPAGAVLGDCARSLALGESTEQALERVRERARSAAWDALVAAVLLQRDAGGDLAALLRDLAGSFEQAERVEREARAATAQARFTALVVGSLPLGGALLAELAGPGFLAGLVADPVSVALAAAAVALQVVGLLVVRRLAR